MDEAGRALREGRVDDLVEGVRAAARLGASAAPELRLRIGSLYQAAVRFGADPRLRAEAVAVLGPLADAVDRPDVAVTARALLATLQLLQGSFHACLALCDAAVELADAAEVRGPGAALAHQFRGYVLFEWNRLAEAEEALRRAWDEAGPEGRGVRSGVARVLASVAAARDDEAGVDRWLQRLGTIVAEPMTLRNREWLGAVRARTLLGRGDLRQVEAWLRAFDYLPGAWREADASRVLGRLQELEGALALLEVTGQWAPLLDLATVVEDVARGRRRWFEARAASAAAVALEVLGRVDEADDAWGRALEAGTEGSFVRAFVEGQPLRLRALGRLARQGRSEAARILDAVPEGAPGDPGLTGRQLDVLRLVERGHSNKAISRELDLSLSTVKTHLRTIFTRLDAGSRTEAVARARDLGLL